MKNTLGLQMQVTNEIKSTLLAETTYNKNNTQQNSQQNDTNV